MTLSSQHLSLLYKCDSWPSWKCDSSILWITTNDSSTVIKSISVVVCFFHVSESSDDLHWYRTVPRWKEPEASTPKATSGYSKHGEYFFGVWFPGILMPRRRNQRHVGMWQGDIRSWYVVCVHRKGSSEWTCWKTEHHWTSLKRVCVVCCKQVTRRTEEVVSG